MIKSIEKKTVTLTLSMHVLVKRQAACQFEV